GGEIGRHRDAVVAAIALDRVGSAAGTEAVVADAADQRVVTGAGIDGVFAARRVVRGVEGDVVADAERAGLDAQRVAGRHRGVVHGEVVAVAGGEAEVLDIDHRGRGEGQPGRIVAVEDDAVAVRAAVDVVGGGQVGAHVEGVVAAAAAEAVDAAGEA